jgi:aspartate/methionine/tyrosine aminotransferase
MEVGQPSTPAPPTARRTAEASLARDEALGYTSANGLPAVKEKIAKWYLDRHGSTVDPARIVVTTGSSAGFILSFLALFDASDLVGVPSTAYPCYRNVLKVLGVTPVALAGDAANPRSGFGFPTPADVTADLKGLILSSPSNPTGATLSADELATLAAHCKSNGVKFISDEIYHHIVYGDETSASAVDMEGALVINSFSKYFSMTGWRIGWLVLPKDDPSLSSAIEKLQQNLFINAPHISQIAAAASFDDVDDVLEGHVAVYERNRQVVLDALEKMGVDPDHIAPAKGAFYVYVDLMAFGVTDAPDLCFRLLNDTGVAITPGVDFEFDESIGKRRVRISYCGAAAAVAAAMDRLTDWWAAGKYK